MTRKIINSKKNPKNKTQTVTQSTLLIPKKLLNYFKSRSNFFGSRKLYFQHLIKTYGRHLNQFETPISSNKWKNKYQESGLDLQPQHFKPSPEFWEEFRHISLACGLAMCHLFVVLLKLEHDRWIQAGKPENFFEKIPHRLQIQKPGMNSWQLKKNITKNSLEKLIKAKKSTLLIRSINFSEMKLERMAIIRQD